MARAGRPAGWLAATMAAMHLLNIESSPRGPRSASIAVTDAFLAAYRAAEPGLTVDTLNVWAEALPDYDAGAIGAKYKGVSGEAMDPAEAKLWDTIKSLAERFRRADRIVVGVPMWNFAPPYKLKQLIDLASHRDLLFTFDGQAFGPALAVPRALVVYTQGQAYAVGTPTPASRFDHQTGYVKFWLELIGVADVRTIVVPNTWGDAAAASIERGKAEAVAMAASF